MVFLFRMVLVDDGTGYYAKRGNIHKGTPGTLATVRASLLLELQLAKDKYGARIQEVPDGWRISFPPGRLATGGLYAIVPEK